MVYDTGAQIWTQTSPKYVTTESYRYDALGRRIWVWSLKPAGCNYAEPSSGCHSTLTRTIWDGSQILGEIRADGSDSANTGALENDDPVSVGPNYGVVAYVNGPGIDAPIEISKNQGAYVVLPMAEYRGMFVTGTCP